MSNLKTADISIPVPWGIIAGRTFGEERNVPVLCVHGRMDNLESFRQLIPLLPHDHYYVCIDLPGHGKSSHPHKGYIPSLFWYTFSIKRLINHFKWSKIYYLGHSLGGQLGFLLSALYPEVVSKLIIIDALLYDHNPASKTAAGLRDLLFDPLFKLENRSNPDLAPTYTVEEFLLKMKEARQTEVTDEQIRPMAERNLVKSTGDKYRYSCDQRTKILGNMLLTFDQLEGIANEICCPSMIILGSDSLMTKPNDRLSVSPLRNNINTSFHIIDGDHDIHLTRPHQVARLVSSFLAGETRSKL